MDLGVLSALVFWENDTRNMGVWFFVFLLGLLVVGMDVVGTALFWLGSSVGHQAQCLKDGKLEIFSRGVYIYLQSLVTSTMCRV